MVKVLSCGVLVVVALQVSRGAPAAAADLPASPAVLVTVMATGTGDRLTPELLTFWRGSERWYQAASQHSSGGGTTVSRNYRLSVGTTSIELELLTMPRRALVGTTKVDLGAANVLLVDAVDTTAGPQSVKTVSIDLSPAGFVDLARQAAAVPEVREFLRCPQGQPEHVVRPYVVCAGLR